MNCASISSEILENKVRQNPIFSGGKSCSPPATIAKNRNNMSSLVIMGYCYSKFWLESNLYVNYLNPIGQFQTEDLSVTTQHPTTFSDRCPPVHPFDIYDCLRLLNADIFYP
jgi:hypothetical protein